MAQNEKKLKTYFLCEACGKYHPEDECEEVYIKIIKGKNCVLNLSKDYTFTSKDDALSHITTPEQDLKQDVSTNKNIIPSGLKKQHAGGDIPVIPAAGNGNGARGNITPASVFTPPV
jgi:hypothetical protein